MTGKHVYLALALLAATGLAACDAPEDRIYGYSEGRYRLLSMDASGTIAQVNVADGDRVAAGAALAALNTAVVDADLAQAKAHAAAAQARLADAQAGGRAQEIAAAQDRLTRAKAVASNAKQDYDRVKPLFDRAVVAKARLDRAVAAMNESAASVAEAKQQLELTMLPARDGQIAALQADLSAAQAAVTAHSARLAQMQLIAPSAGTIERVLRDVGEPASLNAPVIRFLPQGEQKAILFVANAKRSSFSLGQTIDISCDGCVMTIPARIDVLSSEPEFTSPMIFSDQERARLTYRLEAAFLAEAPPSGTPVWAITPAPQ